MATPLHTVLERLRSAGLKVAPDKCRLFHTKLTYLGHLITPDGIGIDPERVQVVADMQPPRTVKEAKRVFRNSQGFANLFLPLASFLSHWFCCETLRKYTGMRPFSSVLTH